jgi:hypothetical protein
MLAYKKKLHVYTITPYFIKRELMVHCTSMEIFCRIISDTHTTGQNNKSMHG